jgi:hypothetical protein
MMSPDPPRKRPRRDLAVLPDAPQIKPDEREQIVAVFRQRIQQIEADAAERVALAQQTTQHPSPVYQRLVKHYAAMGIKPVLISKLLMIPWSVLNTFYEDELVTGTAEINLEIAKAMAAIALDPTHPQAAKVGMDWLSRRGGEEWKPAAQKLEVADDRDKPPVIDSSRLSVEDREALRQMILRAQGGEEPLPGLGGADTEGDE